MKDVRNVPVPLLTAEELHQWFIEEVERRTGATREEMLKYANTQYPNDRGSYWLRRILGEKP